MCLSTQARVPQIVQVLRAPFMCVCVCSVYAWCTCSSLCRFLCTCTCVVCMQMNTDPILWFLQCLVLFPSSRPLHGLPRLRHIVLLFTFSSNLKDILLAIFSLNEPLFSFNALIAICYCIFISVLTSLFFVSTRVGSISL